MGGVISPEAIAGARAAQSAYGVPASVQLAQWALESGWGAHIPPGSNNPFGIKAVGDQPAVIRRTTEVIDGKIVSVEAGFRVFPSLGDAFNDHARLLSQAPQYAKARACLPNLNAYCFAMGRVYASDPIYAAKLLNIIAESDLTQYDDPAAFTPPAPPMPPTSPPGNWQSGITPPVTPLWPQPPPPTAAPAVIAPPAPPAPPAAPVVIVAPPAPWRPSLMDRMLVGILTGRMVNNALLGVSRNIVAGLGASAVTAGAITQSQSADLVGAALCLISLGLTVLDKMVRESEFQTALATPPPSPGTLT